MVNGFKIKKYAIDHDGNLVESPFGGLMMHRDHEIVVHDYAQRIIQLLGSIHGEFCSTDIEDCRCGREIKKLRNGTWEGSVH